MRCGRWSVFISAGPGGLGHGRALGLSELKFTGQVLPNVTKVVYSIDIKRVMRSKLVLGVADGTLSATARSSIAPRISRSDCSSKMPHCSRERDAGLLSPRGIGTSELPAFKNRHWGNQGRRLPGATIARARNYEAGCHHGDGHCLVHRKQHSGSACESVRGQAGNLAGRRLRQDGFPFAGARRAKLDPSEVIDRRAMRFLAEGAAWNHVAMEQAIRDSGLEPSDISTSRRASSWVRAARPRAPLWRPPTSPAPRARSVSGRSPCRDTRHLVQDQGRELSISSACATSNHCIGNAYETIQIGKQDIIFAGRMRRTRLVAVGIVRRHGRHVLEVQRYADHRIARL